MKQKNDDMTKQLPYQESEEYLEALLDRVTREAVRQQQVAPVSKRWSLARWSAVAAVVLALGIGLTVLNHEPKRVVVATTPASPIDEFLNTLTDEEVARLPYYEIEEIPEY